MTPQHSPSISVIVITHNEARTITATLRRLVPLLGPRDELLVIDGESTDATPELASRYARTVDGPRGRSALFNLGGALARCDILLFLHADARLPTTGLHRIRRAMRSHLSPLGGFFAPELIPERSTAAFIAFPWVSRLLTLRSRLFNLGTGEQGLFVRRNAFERLAGFQALPLLEDLDFARRLTQMGPRLVMLSPPMGIRGRHWESRGVLNTLYQRTLFLLAWRLGLSREALVERLRALRSVRPTVRPTVAPRRPRVLPTSASQDHHLEGLP